MFASLYIAVIMSTFVVRMTTARIGEYHYLVLWLLIAIIFPISQLLFLFCFYSIRKLQWKFIKKAAYKWRCCCCYFWWCRCTKCLTLQNKGFHDQLYISQTPTVPKSTRISPLSNTYLHVPYTNNFTHITTDNLPLVPVDTEYGSVSQRQC